MVSNKKKEVNILHPFIENIVCPALKKYAKDGGKLVKGDIIRINYDESTPNFLFTVVKAKYKKNDSLDLEVSFEPTKEMIKSKKLVYEYKKYNSGNFFNKKVEMPITIVSNKIALLTLKIDNIHDPLYSFTLESKPSFNLKYEKYQNSKCKNYLDCGVITSKINSDLVDKLLNEVDIFAKNSKKDYHPFSNKKIRDIIHPSMFPYINGITKLNKQYNKEKSNLFSNGNEEVDFWNRKYENSIYQWLPSEFKIDSKGNCKIESYINNLPENYGALTDNIEELFDKVLPYFEKIWSYIKSVKLYDNESVELYGKEKKLCSQNRLKDISLKNRTLQVITKIVTYELKDEKIEGAWHVEGMSHENIVATAVTVLEQDDNVDAELLFKRRFTQCEGATIHSSTGQERPMYLNNYLGYYVEKNEEMPTGLVPLCKTSTQKGSLTVFPNSHIHKLDVKNNSKRSGRRTVIVFWLVNPDRRVISTKYVDPQQKTIKLKDAENHRLKLMEERKYHKQKFNVRDLNLCEH